jgi:hypothetical protein
MTTPLRRAAEKRIVFGVILGAMLIGAPLLSTAYAQPDFVGSEISGRYLDSSSGLQIELPKGWSGTKFFDMFPIIAPNGFDLSTGTMPEVAMTILVLDSRDVAEMLLSVNIDEISEVEDADEQCQKQIIEYAQIGSTTGLHIIVECEGDEESGTPYQKTKAYSVLTRTKFIIIAYSATSESEYERHLGEFEHSIKSVKVVDPVNLKSSLAAIFRANKAFEQTVSVKGQHVNIKIETSSNLSNFRLSEEEKKLSFTVEGTTGTKGVAVIPLHNVLAGPYTVTIDGQPTEDFIVIVDKTTGEQIMQLSYSHSVHDIAITGASVVPEFPVQLIAILGALIGIIAVIGRTKLMSRSQL